MAVHPQGWNCVLTGDSVVTDVAYYLSFALNAALCVAACATLRTRVIGGRLHERRAKTIYSWSALMLGLISGIVLFNGMVAAFQLSGFSASYGHGEIILAAALFNVLLSVATIAIGRICLGRNAMLWS